MSEIDHEIQTISQYFIPRYNMTSVFLMSISFLVLCVIEIKLQTVVSLSIKVLFEIPNSGTLIDFIIFLFPFSIFLFLLLGMLSPFLYVWLPKKKISDSTKDFMVGFAAFINLLGAAASFTVVNAGMLTNFLYIFSLINLYSGGLLFTLWLHNKYTASHFNTYRNSVTTVALSTVALLILLYILYYLLHWQWENVFSASLAFATVFSYTGSSRTTTPAKTISPIFERK